MSKPFHLAPDIAQSIDSGQPAPWLASDIARSIANKASAPWLARDIAEDIDAASGGGGDWILANGVWDDAAPWDDTALWKDAA